MIRKFKTKNQLRKKPAIYKITVEEKSIKDRIKEVEILIARLKPI